jgi:hypothetical protein
MSGYFLTFLGTLLLVIITLYIGVIRPWLNRPKFYVTFDNTEPYCRQTEIEVSKDLSGFVTKRTTAYWIRLRVTNSGKSVAKRCIGKLVKVMKQSGEELAEYDPFSLHWVGTDPDEIPLKPVDLNRGEYEYLDLIYTSADAPKKAFIYTDHVPRGIPTFINPGEYILQVTIYADNADPETKKYRLIWKASDFLDIKLKAE